MAIGNLSLGDLRSILDEVIFAFKIVYVDFASPEFVPYWKRKIGAVVRFDQKTIYIHCRLSRKEEELSWVHEALSIYYYQRDILRHDGEIEEETKRIYREPEARSLIAERIDSYKRESRCPTPLKE